MDTLDQYGTFPQSGNISVKRVTFPNWVTKHYLIKEHVTRFTVIPVISERADGCCKGRFKFIYFGIQNTFFPELSIKIKFLPCRFQDKAMIDNMDRNKNMFGQQRKIICELCAKCCLIREMLPVSR